MLETALLLVSSGALAGSLLSLLNKFLSHRKKTKVRIEIDGRNLEIKDIKHLRTDEIEDILRMLESSRDSTGDGVKGVP